MLDLTGTHSPASRDPRQTETPLIDSFRSTVLGPEFVDGRSFVSLQNAGVKQDTFAFGVFAPLLQCPRLTSVDDIFSHDQDISAAGWQLRHQCLIPPRCRQGWCRRDGSLLKTAWRGGGVYGPGHGRKTDSNSGYQSLRPDCRCCA